MRDQRFRRHAAIDRPLGRGRLHHSALAGAAAIAWTTYHLHSQLGRNQIEHLAAVVADHMQCAATAGTCLVLDIDDDLVTRQVCRQRTTIAVGYLDAPPSRRRLCRVFGGVAFGGTLLGILQHELQLIEVELLRTGTVAMPQQTLDQQPQLLVLGLQLRHHLPQHLLQGIRIVRQGREINLHNTMMMMHAVASQPMTPA